MASREERELAFRKGQWIDYPFEPCWNEYWLYTSDRILREPLLHLEDVAAHLWFCARYHPDHPSSAEYTWAELAAVWFGDPAREKAAKAIVSRLQAAGLIEVESRRGRGLRSRVTPYDPLLEADFRLAAAKGCFSIPAQERVLASCTPAELEAFDFAGVRESHRVLKPRSFLRGRGWEPCLRTVFDLYLGDLVEVQEQDGRSWIPLPGPGTSGEAGLIPWDGPRLTRGRAVAHLTATPLLDLATIALALWLRKRADQARLQREPWVTVSVSQMRRQFHLRWTAVDGMLTALEKAGLARRVGGGRQAGAKGANVALRFLLWDPCESAAQFLQEVEAGEIRADISPLGAAAAARFQAGPSEGAAPARKRARAEQGARKHSQREQGTSTGSENTPNGNKGASENPTVGSKGLEIPEGERRPIQPAASAPGPEKGPQPEQHEHRDTNHRTTTMLPKAVVAALDELAIAPEQIPAGVTATEVEELTAVLGEIQPGEAGYESRDSIALAWLQHGPGAAVLAYLAAAADIRSSVARKKGLAELPFAYVRDVTAHIWRSVRGTPDQRYLAARVVRWLEARDPLPESRARPLRFDTADDGGADDGHDLRAARPPDERQSYAEMLGVPLDLAPWERALQEFRRAGITPPEWAASALLDVHGPRKAGRGDSEVWLLVPSDVDIEAAGRYLWDEGGGKIVERAVHRDRPGAAPAVAMGRYADLVGYLRKLRGRAHAAWGQVKERLQPQLTPSDYATWVEQTAGGDLHLGDHRLTAYSQPGACAWLRREAFLRLARREVQEVLGAGWSVEIRAVGPGTGSGS